VQIGLYILVASYCAGMGRRNLLAGSRSALLTELSGVSYVGRQMTKRLKRYGAKPMGLALIICDQVITEAGTNKKSLIGVFNRIHSVKYPSRHSRLCIFVSMTSGHGDVEAKIQCVNEDAGDKVLFGANGQITFESPIQVVEMNFEFNNVLFPMPGKHRFEFLCNDFVVLQRPFVVNQVQGDRP